MTTSLASKCKMCGKTVVAKADDTCPQSWIDKLLPMLTCNRCYDLHCLRRKLERQIGRATRLLQFEKLKDGERASLIRAIRASMVEYAKWFAQFSNQPQYHFEESLVDNLTDHPDKVWEILFQFRKTVRSLYDSQPPAQTNTPYAD